MTSPTPFNPLDKSNLGASVGEALLGRKPQPLGHVPRFQGAGIYALYYLGTFDAYASLGTLNRESNGPTVPIYVGKAVPRGARKGGSLDSTRNTTALWRRLQEHAESIRLASNLRIEDFSCRYLVVDDIWIPLGETLLIAKFSPIWNSFIDGFGNHDPGKGRYAGMRTRWDTLHPGRAWAEKCSSRPEVASDIGREIHAQLQRLPPPKPHFLVEDLRGKYAVDRDSK